MYHFCISSLLGLIGWSEATSPARLTEVEEKIISSKFSSSWCSPCYIFRNFFGFFLIEKGRFQCVVGLTFWVSIFLFKRKNAFNRRFNWFFGQDAIKFGHLLFSCNGFELELQLSISVVKMTFYLPHSFKMYSLSFGCLGASGTCHHRLYLLSCNAKSHQLSM